MWVLHGESSKLHHVDEVQFTRLGYGGENDEMQSLYELQRAAVRSTPQQ